MIDRRAGAPTAPAAYEPPPSAPPAEAEERDVERERGEARARGALAGAAGAAYLLQGAWSLLAQFFFIGSGVFLGIQADQWKEDREHRQAARATLVDFRTELLTNRERLARYRPIYQRYADTLQAAERRGDRPPRRMTEVFERLGWEGLNPVRFDRTAWELALATQSLNYVPRPLAFRVARLYDAQAMLVEFQREASAALFNPLAFDDARVMQWLLTFNAYVVDSRQISAQIDEGMGRILTALDSTIARLPR